MCNDCSWLMLIGTTILSFFMSLFGIVGGCSPEDRPVADGQEIVTAYETPVQIYLTGAGHEADTPLVFSVKTTPVHGVISGEPPDLLYSPARGFSGEDAFTFQVNDGKQDSEPATIKVTVGTPTVVCPDPQPDPCGGEPCEGEGEPVPVNHQPVANGQAVSTAYQTALGITLRGSDPDGDALTFLVRGNPTHGTINGVAPNLVYTPNSGYSGGDSLTFVVSDGRATSTPATVSITVGEVPCAPTTVFLTAQPTTGTAPLTVTLAANTSYCSEVSMEGYSWSFGDGTSLDSGSVPMATHTFTAVGTYVVRVQVRDSKSHIAEATVTITVT
jgi:plastocyanin